MVSRLPGKPGPQQPFYTNTFPNTVLLLCWLFGRYRNIWYLPGICLLSHHPSSSSCLCVCFCAYLPSPPKGAQSSKHFQMELKTLCDTRRKPRPGNTGIVQKQPRDFSHPPAKVLSLWCRFTTDSGKKRTNSDCRAVSLQHESHAVPAWA